MWRCTELIRWTFITCLAITLGTVGNAQEAVVREMRVFLNAGLAQTFHFNAPTQTGYCQDDCVIDFQRAESSSSLNLGLMTAFNARHGILAAIGFSELRFFESGRSIRDDGYLLPYHRVEESRFFSLCAGHWLTLFESQKVQINLENSLVSDLVMSTMTPLHQINWSYKGKVDTGLEIHPGLWLNGGVFFKTAIHPYNRDTSGDRYFPYAIGAEIGVCIMPGHPHRLR